MESLTQGADEASKYIEIIFEALQSSEKIKEELPELDSIIHASVDNLPNIFPAIKQRYKVTTKYQLPIRILLKE